MIHYNIDYILEAMAFRETQNKKAVFVTAMMVVIRLIYVYLSQAEDCFT